MATVPEPRNRITRKQVNASKAVIRFQRWKEQLVASSRPRRYGGARSELQQAWIDKFSRMAKATKTPDPCALSISQYMTAGTGWYYRDMLTVAMSGKLIEEEGETRITTPTVNAKTNGAQNVTQGQWNVVPFDATIWDNNDFWRPSPNPERLIFRSAGLYAVGLTVMINGNSGSNVHHLRLVEGGDRSNPTTVVALDHYFPIQANPLLTSSSLFYFHPNEYIECHFWPNGSSPTIDLVSVWAVGITPEAIIP